MQVLDLPLIAVFVGKNGHGKSYASKHIRQCYNNVFPVSFSSLLKEFAVRIGFNKESVYGSYEDKKKADNAYNIVNRVFLEKCGVLMRNELYKIDPSLIEVFVNFTKKRILKIIKNNTNVKDLIIVIDDCRFDDELDMLLQLQNNCIATVATFKIKLEKTDPNEIQSTHISNTNFEKWDLDYCISNNKTPDYRRTIDDILRKYSKLRYLSSNVLQDITTTEDMNEYLSMTDTDFGKIMTVFIENHLIKEFPSLCTYKDVTKPFYKKIFNVYTVPIFATIMGISVVLLKNIIRNKK